MVLVVMGEGPATNQLQGKAGLSAIQGLNLALSIDAEDDCILRGRHVDADDVGEVLDEEGVPREL